MSVIRCPRCKKMYEFSGLPPQCCPECYLIEEDKYSNVREYVKNNRGATVIQVEQATGVSRLKVIQYIREERLEIIPNTTSFLKCTKCGKIINTGMLCDACRRLNG